MRILALETSCDETGAAVIEKSKRRIRMLSNVLATSSGLHAKTGGVIPEFAAREQIKAIIPVIVEALLSSENIKSKTQKENFYAANKILKDKIDSIAITYGPGLIGSLLVGVETAKTLSFGNNKPIIPVNHLLAHLFANFIDRDELPTSPFVGLIVSGGHTDLLFFESLKKYRWLGGTRDDAAGEAIDKIGRLLKLSYPAGVEMEKRAASVEKTRIQFKSPLINSNDLDFSFSGLKAEVARFVEKQNLTEELINEICFATQKAVIDVLVKKTVLAAKKFKAKTVLLGGGVSANKTLRKVFENSVGNKVKVFVPEKILATDNAAMVGAYAALNYKPVDWHTVTAQPNLYFN